jgi:hypothetical protein
MTDRQLQQATGPAASAERGAPAAGPPRPGSGPRSGTDGTRWRFTPGARTLATRTGVYAVLRSTVTYAMEYVDYRRYADYGKSAATTAIEGARGRAAEARVEEPPAPDAAATLPDRLPVWWLFFLPLYWFPQSINWGLIQTYLLPFEVEDIVGQSRKQFFLSLMVTSSNVGSFFGPVSGAAAGLTQTVAHAQLLTRRYGGRCRTQRSGRMGGGGGARSSWWASCSSSSPAQ